MDVCLYDAECKETLWSDIRIKAEEITFDEATMEGPLEYMPVAVLVNANNKGYCRVVLDQQSMDFFLANLSKIENSSNRSYLWRILADQVVLLRMKPIQYLECVFAHMPKETDGFILPFIIEKAKYMLKYYFPEM